jgi:hypothetical protein
VSTAEHPLTRPEWAQARRTALVVALAGAAVFVGAGAVLHLARGITSPRQFFLSYLVAYTFWLGTGLGCLALLMVQHLTGGRWGLVIRRVLESGSRTIVLLALLFVPVVLGAYLGDLYLWVHPDPHDEDLLHKTQWYLTIPGFVIRAVVYFVVWLLLAFVLSRWSREQDDNAAFPPRRFRLLSGPGLVLYGLTITFASIDWVMSLNPNWYSTIYPPLFATSQVLNGLAFAILVFLLLAAHRPLSETLDPQLLRDLGNLLLAFIMIWAYLSFSQFLLVWVGNLPEETPWYLQRGRYGWQWVALALFLLNFAVPFLLLLQREVKERPRRLAAIAVLVLVMRLVDVFWWVEPAYAHEGQYAFFLLDLAAWAAVGGVWVWWFLGQLESRPLLPRHDPILPAVLRHEIPAEGTVP